MKHFLIRFLFLIPIPVLIISVNYFEDPANLFNKKYESGIVDYLVQGNNVTNVVNYNERLLQKFFIEKMSKCPGEIALGASQIMQINSTYLKETNFINNGVSGATLEDDLAIYYLYEKKNCKIQKIIFGLDPYLLNDNHNQIRWKVLGNEYGAFLNKLLKNRVANNPEAGLQHYAKFKELMSISYFKTSLTYLIKRVDKKYKPTTKMVNNGFTRLKDGAIYYNASFRDASKDEVEEKAKSVIAVDPVYSLGNFTHLSEHYKSIFSSFVEYLQNQNVEVEFFLSPYHPIVYEYFKKNKYYHIVFETENYFKNYASSHKIKVFGSYDPANYNFDNSYFLDGFHCTEKAVRILLERDNK